MLSAHLGKRKDNDRIAAAAAIELACMAHDIHSNVLETDNTGGRIASQVHGQGINWGNMFSMMAGNYLLSKSYALGTELGCEITQMLSQASSEVCLGKMLEINTHMT